MIQQARLFLIYPGCSSIQMKKCLMLLDCNTVCGPEWGEITAQKALIYKLGIFHHPACASLEVADAASSYAFH